MTGRVGYPGRVGANGWGPFTNWSFDDARIGSRNTPITKNAPPTPPSGYTPQVMMVM